MEYTVEDLLRGGGMAAPEEDPGFQPMQKDQYEIAALLATLPDSEVELTRMLYEQQQAEGMMGDGPEGRMIGRTYVAPQTTEYAAQLADAYRGSQRESAATERYDQGVSDRDNAVTQLLDALRGRKPEASADAELDPYAGSI